MAGDVDAQPADLDRSAAGHLAAAPQHGAQAGLSVIGRPVRARRRSRRRIASRVAMISPSSSRAVATITGTLDTARSMRSASRPVHVGEAEVEQRDVRRVVEHLGARPCPSMFRRPHSMLRSPSARACLADACVVFHHDDRHGGNVRHGGPST
ncbi:MAG: hypothetical protein R2699_09280 [Acidimicrobiales bacterium]